MKVSFEKFTEIVVNELRKRLSKDEASIIAFVNTSQIDSQTTHSFIKLNYIYIFAASSSNLDNQFFNIELYYNLLYLKDLVSIEQIIRDIVTMFRKN